MCLSRSASEQRKLDMMNCVKVPPHVHQTPLQRDAQKQPIEAPAAAESSRKAEFSKDPPPESSSMAGMRRMPNRGSRDNLAELLGDEEDDARSRAALQWREFGLIYIAYMGFLVSRKNYGFWLRSVISEYGYEKGQAGLLGSTLEVTYGTCSFLNGVVIDSRSPKHLLLAGLVLSAALNLGVSNTDSLPLMILLWGLNGAVQSVGWPSVTNIFLAWFPDPAARGAWYSLLSTCQNAGAALVPLLVSASVASYGWRAALYAPAAASALVALLLALLLYGSPRAATSSPPIAKAKPSSADLAHTMREQVFLNKSLWLMAITYFGVSMVRTCLQDWTSLYLSEAKGLPLAASARCLFLWEIGGFGGTFIAGYVSDRVFAGRRGPVVCICCGLLAPSLWLLLRAQDEQLIQGLYLWLGFCAFPVHVLLGLFSREVVPPAVSSSAGGFVKCIAQIGGAAAGYPLGRLQQSYGWDGVQLALAAVSIVSAGVACSLWSTRALGRINGRHGTIADLNALSKQASSIGSSQLQSTKKQL